MLDLVHCLQDFSKLKPGIALVLTAVREWRDRRHLVDQMKNTVIIHKSDFGMHMNVMQKCFPYCCSHS